MYTIRYDSMRRIFHLTLNGFWTMPVIIKFGAELLVRTTAIRVRGHRYAMLSDASAFPVQSAQVTSYFERIMARGIEIDVGPCAIVVASQLNKLQAERSLRSDRVRVFLDRDEAEAWLATVWR